MHVEAHRNSPVTHTLLQKCSRRPRKKKKKKEKEDDNQHTLKRNSKALRQTSNTLLF